MLIKFFKTHKTTLVGLFGVVVFFVLPNFVLAQGADFGTNYLTSIGLSTTDIRVTIVNILRIVYGILGLVTLILIIYAGFIWMTSAGKPDAILQAKKIIINAIIGLLIIILALAITEFIFRQIIKAQSGGGGFTCSSLQCLSQCTACNATGNGTTFNSTCFACTLGGSSAFNLTEVQTAHSGTNPKQDVYTCSRLQPRFNNRLAQATVAGNVEVIDRNTASQVSGSWSISSKTLKFTPVSNLASSTGYEIRFYSDPGLEDLSGDPLEGCNGTVCETAGPPYFGWEFDTGTETDISPPAVISAYPILATQIGYPTRTVPRAATIDVNFDESIDFFSIEDPLNPGHPDPAKFVIEKMDCPGNVPTTCQSLTPPEFVDNSNLVISDKNSGFRIKTAGGFFLDSFTWYEITVQDVLDLCGNLMSPTPVVWVFETNDALPGVKSVTPKDGANNICPDQDVYFTFGTAMYDELVVLGISTGGVPQYIDLQATELNTAKTIAGLGRLEVTDPGLPVDNKFRAFKFTPAAPLSVGTTYSLTIDAPNFVIDNNGNTLHYPVSPNTWQFSVADASTCACEPYISSINPAQGPHGQCLTIKGSCFAGTSDHPGSITAVDIGGVGHTINGQGSNYVTTEVSSSLAQNTNHLATVTLTYSDPNFGSVTSNSDPFYVTADPPFTGPCLYNISPAQACHNASVALSGARFGTTQDTVNFSLSGNVPAGNISSWSNNQAKFSVPTGWPQGFQDVSVVVGGQSSNILPFNISCVLPPGPGFKVAAVWPDCNTACLNSQVGARFSSDINPVTVTNNSVDVLPCTDSNCTSFGSEPGFIINVVGDEIQIDNIALSVDTYYRAILHNKIAGLNGILIENLNYDSGSGSPDSYSWIFKTTDQNCTITDVETAPATININGLGKSKSISGKAKSDQQCGSNKYINPWPYNWSWVSADTGIATVASIDSDNDGKIDPVQAVTSVSANSTQVEGSTSGYSSQSQINITNSGGGQQGDPCDGDLSNQPTCDPLNSMCDTLNGYSCNVTSCTCENSGLQCDNDTSTLQCNPNNNLCNPVATCNTSTCWCPLPIVAIKTPITPGCDQPTVDFTNSQGGMANFYVDGSLVGSVNYNASPPTNSFNLPAGSVPLGQHTIAVEIKNGNGNGVDSTPYTNNCYSIPAVLSVNPSAGVLQCANTSFSVMFNQLMKTTGAEKYFELRSGTADPPPQAGFYLSNYVVPAGFGSCVSVDGCTVFVIAPQELLPTTGFVELEVKSGIESIYNISLPAGQIVKYTTNNASVCALDGVEILPPGWLSTRLNASRTFFAREYSNQSGRVYITPIADYDWTLVWDEDDPDSLIVPTPAGSQNTVVTPVTGKGRALISATATITADNIFGGSHLGRERSGTAAIRVFICDYPWPALPPYNIYDTINSVNLNTEMMYCRGSDPLNLLPNLVNEVNLLSGGGKSQLVKDSIFTIDGTQGNITGADIIGLRVFKNPKHASAKGWYDAQGFPQGNPQSTVIDGYPAVIDGRTIYIHFTNLSANTATSYIFVLSHNQKPTPETVSIYKGLLKNLYFNSNINFSDKVFLQQDLERIGGLGTVAEMIKAYGAHPSLNSGTYIKGVSTSRWPSWQAVLGNRLGKSLPIDPENVFYNCPDSNGQTCVIDADCPNGTGFDAGGTAVSVAGSCINKRCQPSGYDSASCFNVNLSPEFFCPDGSHIYIYQDTGDLYANLAYKGITWAGVGGSNDNGCFSFNISTGLTN